LLNIDVENDADRDRELEMTMEIKLKILLQMTIEMRRPVCGGFLIILFSGVQVAPARMSISPTSMRLT